MSAIRVDAGSVTDTTTSVAGRPVYVTTGFSVGNIPDVGADVASANENEVVAGGELRVGAEAMVAAVAAAA